jgi:hypothetical protein
MICDRRSGFLASSRGYQYFLSRNYKNLTAVAQQVNAYVSIPNLLNWETAHEPDGNADPLNATELAYDLIYQMDGYHPVSIVLNCQDYDFSPYVIGADIVLHVGHSEHSYHSHF